MYLLGRSLEKLDSCVAEQEKPEHSQDKKLLGDRKEGI